MTWGNVGGRVCFAPEWGRVARRNQAQAGRRRANLTKVNIAHVKEGVAMADADVDVDECLDWENLGRMEMLLSGGTSLSLNDVHYVKER